MNYSVFKLQNQAGKPSIFWEKETIPKKDKKFGYRQRDQRFPVRRYPGDKHHIESDLVTLTPDEPAPPPKPAKNFIKKNREKVTVPTKGPTAGTVTLTQEQLNAILRSVGKVAGGSENAVKISIDQTKNKKEILVESPRRHGDDDDYDDHRERRRKKKTNPDEDQGNSIYNFLGGGGKPKSKASSDNESEGSVELRRLTRKYKRSRREKKSQRHDDGSDDEDRPTRNKNRNRHDDNDDEEELIRDIIRKNRSKRDTEDEDNDRRGRRTRSKPRQNDIDDEIEALRRQANEIKELRKQTHIKPDDDSDNENRKPRQRRNRSKPRDSDYDDDLDTRDIERKDRTKKSDRSRERRGKQSREMESDPQNYSVNNEEDAELPSPRDKVGLPVDLSWRHMTKAERRRLEMARQKVTNEDERKEEERIKQMNTRYAPPDTTTKPSPQRHKPPPPRSDPATRLAGRVTENSNYTDNNRRGRRSRSATPDRSPEVPSYTSPVTVDTSPKGPLAVPRRHMTLAEKKRIEWERERVESVQLQQHGGTTFEPWGRPGAGAPLRTKSGNVVADYKGRQDQMHHSTIIEETPSVPATSQERTNQRAGHRQKSPPPPPVNQSTSMNQDVPHAMRSSFVLGQAAPDYESQKERERKQWLAELEAQIEEKRMKDSKPHNAPGQQDTWADKLGQSHRALPFPEQPKDTVSGQGDPFNTSANQGGGVLPLESHRDVHSAPDGTLDDQSYIRGQNVPMDPVTKRELEDKRRKYLDHQAAVKAQVEEKERLKRQAREMKMREDMEEERKLQQERESLNKQFEQEQMKSKQKEQQRQTQVNQLKAAMDEAQAKALQEKYQRKVQHLEAGGHDTSKLREHLEGEITSRIEQLHTRRERDVQNAKRLLELRFWGMPPEEEEEPTAQQPKQQQEVALGEPDHDDGNTAKITPRDQDGMPSHIPGLDLYTSRTHNQAGTTRRDQSTRHEPYMEDRVLTPSRFRHPSKPWSDPESPRREFGTQTGKVTDLNESASSVNGEGVSQLLNPRFNREETDVQIEYRYEKGKKVRVVSAPKDAIEKRGRRPTREPREPRRPPSNRGSVSPHEHHHEIVDQKAKQEVMKKKKLELQRRKGPVKPGSRPMWGYKNADLKKPKKQSERDPFFEQKKKESDLRRMKREQKLLAMVNANKEVIPDYYVPPPKSSRSRSRDQSPFSDIEMGSPREVKLSRRSMSHSPHRQRLHGETDFLSVHADKGPRSKRHDHSQSPARPESPKENRMAPNRPSRNSPPVPALRHRNENNNQNVDPSKRKGGKYGDIDPLDAPVNGDFVPFTRTIDVLDPSKAEEPVPLSREATRVANARKAYFEGLHPEKFGNKQYVYVDKHRVLPSGSEPSKDPMINPSLVLDHPTTRQDQILVQLSTLKQSLMQRQRELETFSPSDLVRYDTGINA